MASKCNSIFNILIRTALYPVLFLCMLCYAALELSGPPELLGQYYAAYLAVLMGVLLLIEWRNPLQPQWCMTSSSFFRRDLPYSVIAGATMFLAQLLAGWGVIWLGMTEGGAFLDLGLIPSVIITLLMVDLLWYWLHRWGHEGRGRVGCWLWRVHVAHHLPQQVYLLMHGVSHPLNVIFVRTLFTVPAFLLGVTVEGLVSHFNVNMRVGWVNYLLMGAELHRYHHSADPHEAKNYASTVAVWDLLFGTHVYRPDVLPNKLGVAEPEKYPADREIIKVMKLPFLKSGRSTAVKGPEYLK